MNRSFLEKVRGDDRNGGDKTEGEGEGAGRGALNRLRKDPGASIRGSGIDYQALRSAYRSLSSCPPEVEAAMAEGVKRLLAREGHPLDWPVIPEQLRVYLIILEGPLIHKPEYHFHIMSPLCGRLIQVNPKLSTHLLHWFSHYREHGRQEFRRMVEALQTFITFRTYARAHLYADAGILSAVKSLGFFSMANSLDKEIVSFQLFYNQNINQLIDVAEDYKKYVLPSSSSSSSSSSPSSSLAAFFDDYFCFRLHQVVSFFLSRYMCFF